MYVFSCVCWSSDHECSGVGLLTLSVLVWLCVFVVFGVCLRSVLMCWSSDHECCVVEMCLSADLGCHDIVVYMCSDCRCLGVQLLLLLFCPPFSECCGEVGWGWAVSACSLSGVCALLQS